jgi:hypothetical protein
MHIAYSGIKLSRENEINNNKKYMQLEVTTYTLAV